MKNNLLLIAIFLSGAVLGAFGMHWWALAHTQPAACAVRTAQADLLLAQLENAALPNDMQEVNVPDNTPKSSSQLPSQLVRSELPEDIVIGTVATQQPAEEKTTGIILSDEQNTVLLHSKRPAQRAADGTSITMLEAPVAVKRIRSLDEYKQFKQVARGSYPAADFTKEEVVVLESQSNLPDNVFEIVEVLPGEETVKVLYRVNVFGLDKKTNTHSAKAMPKSQKNIVLEQVL